MERSLKEYRKSLGITCRQAAEGTNIPFRTYIRYEGDDSYGSQAKREWMFAAIKEKFEVNEEKGILSLEEINNIVGKVLDSYGDQVTFCYLFGSYAKGYPGEESDVDLLVDTSLTGFSFFGLAEDLRVALHKRVDLIRQKDIHQNPELLYEIMRYGIRIYEKPEE